MTVLVLVMAFCLTSCSAKAIAYNNYDYFGSPLEAIVYGSSKNVENWEKETITILENLKAELDPSYIHSDIYNFNNAKDDEKVEISANTFMLINQAKQIYDLTNGAYNPCVYYLVDLWGFSNVERENYYGRTWQGEGKESYLPLPSEDYIKAFTELANFDKVEIAENDGKFYLEKKNTLTTIGDNNYYLKVDLGGLIKGYATDLIFEKANEMGINKGYLSYGTSSIIVATNDKGQSFDLTLTNPRKNDIDTNITFAKIPIKNISVSTSGDYERYYMVDGNRYSHLIDGSTGYPINNNVFSATIFCKNSRIADMLSTALIVMGKDRAIEFLKSDYCVNNDITGLFTYKNEDKIEVYSTANNIEITNSNFELENIK